MKQNLILYSTTVFILATISQHRHLQNRPQKYYVSEKGSDSNDGSVAHPFQSIDKINSLQFVPGDTIFFHGGQVFNGSLIIGSGFNGARGKPVIITSYGRGKATIDAKDSTGMSLRANSFIGIKNIKLVGSGRKTGNTKDGISVVNCANISVDGVDISGFQKSGLLIFSSRHVTIANVFVHNNGSAGITVEGPYQKRESSNIRILNCRAENNPGDPTKFDNHSGNGIVVGNCKNVLIDHCTATNNGWDMPRIGNGPVGIWAYEADSVIIQHCLSYRNKTSVGGADGGGFDFDGGVTNSTIQYCFSYENQGSGYCIFQYWGASPWHHNTYRYNISENDGTVSDSQAGVYIWNSSRDETQLSDCNFYGNIIYNSKVAAISFSSTSKSKNLHFYNNIFVAKDTLIVGQDELNNASFVGNDWWSLSRGFNMYGERNFKKWAIESRKEVDNGRVVGLNEDPGFKLPGKAALHNAAQLKTFTNYSFPENSILPKRLGMDKSGWE